MLTQTVRVHTEFYTQPAGHVTWGCYPPVHLQLALDKIWWSGTFLCYLSLFIQLEGCAYYSTKLSLPTSPHSFKLEQPCWYMALLSQSLWYDMADKTELSPRVGRTATVVGFLLLDSCP